MEYVKKFDFMRTIYNVMTACTAYLNSKITKDFHI